MLKVNSVGHDVAGKSLFHDLSFSMKRKKYGMVGANGIGKTSLAKILAGELTPSHGYVERSVEVQCLAQIQSPPAGHSVGEYIMDIWDHPNAVPELLNALTHDLQPERSLASR